MMLGTLLALAWIISVIAAFTAGEMRGQRVSDKWWHQYGAQIFAERGALIYGTALYKEPSPTDIVER